MIDNAVQTGAEIKILNKTVEELQEEVTVLKISAAGGTIETDTEYKTTVVSGNIDASDKAVTIYDAEFPDTAVLSGGAEITGSEITVKGGTITDGRAVFTANGDIAITDLNTAGSVTKAKNYQLLINTEGAVNISDSDLVTNGYNCVEVGLGTNTKPATEINITNVIFSGTLSNNCINTYATADGCVVNIEGCTITDCSNPIRISNTLGGKLTINITDCEFTKWDSGEYAGMIICQDFTSDDPEATNLFGSDKVTINITNCTHAGEKIEAENVTFGSKDPATQLLYVYYDKPAAHFVDFDANLYPTVNIK